jgi:hypothetical protein
VKNAIGSERNGNDSLAREANVIADKFGNLSLIGGVEASHDVALIRIVDLSLNEVKKPWMEGVGVFKNNCIRAVVLTAGCCWDLWF